MQKVLLARALHRRPRILVAAQPTRGLDIGTFRYVHSQLEELRDAGAGVLLVSEDLDELRALADRVVVVLRGAIVGELSAAEATNERLGRADDRAGRRLMSQLVARDSSLRGHQPRWLTPVAMAAAVVFTVVAHRDPDPAGRGQPAGDLRALPGPAAHQPVECLRGAADRDAADVHRTRGRRSRSGPATATSAPRASSWPARSA